jgi:hypothetical protein
MWRPDPDTLLCDLDAEHDPADAHLHLPDAPELLAGW